MLRRKSRLSLIIPKGKENPRYGDFSNHEKPGKRKADRMSEDTNDLWPYRTPMKRSKSLESIPEDASLKLTKKSPPPKSPPSCPRTCTENVVCRKCIENTHVPSAVEDFEQIRMDSFTYKISEDVTVLQSPLVKFSYPPTFSYTVLETGEKFSGDTGEAKEDYKRWKERCQIKQEKSLMSEPTELTPLL